MAISHDILILLLIGYVLSRTGRNFNNIGLKWRWSDFPISIGVFVLALFASYAAQLFTVAIWTSHPAYWRDTTSLFGKSPSTMIVLYMVVNPFFEELVVRSYLMTEIFEITGKWWVAISVSVGLQSIIHVYQGWSNVIALAAVFSVFALYFSATRRAAPVVLAHLMQDVMAVAMHFSRQHYS